MSEKKLGMLIDLSLCIGCNACAVACKQENDTPVGCFNTWIESWDVQKPDGSIARVNMPKQCNHCENPACVTVCPTCASYVAEDGTVQVDEDRCIGCKYCMAACPYGVRYVLDTGEAQKCTFCEHRTQYGLLPACVGTCVTKARIFGDLNDPDSDISKALAEAGDKAETFMDDLGLGPKLYYLGLSDSMEPERVSAVHKGGNVLKPFEGSD